MGRLWLLLVILAPLLNTTVVANPVNNETNYDPSDTATRILYIITALREHNNGRRGTTRGSNRLKETLIPVLSESVTSMMSPPYNYKVDVYLVLGFDLRPERLEEITNVLPPGVNVSVWSNAIQLTYDRNQEPSKILEVTRTLARQHRFVIKDKLADYDMFVVFEDDMLIKGEHVHHYIQMTNEINRLRQEATIHRRPPGMKEKFYGNLTRMQLNRMIPGFIRVEVLLDESKYGTQTIMSRIPVDLEVEPLLSNSGTKETIVVNSSVCCQLSNKMLKTNLPQHPTPDKIFLWETCSAALGVREMPESSFLSWVAMQQVSEGHNPNHLVPYDKRIGQFASTYALPTGKPLAEEINMRQRLAINGDGTYINNQGGWMATQQQIWEWHTEECKGSFLPPFDEPVYKFDGLDMRNVEYWSGGLQLAQNYNSCGLQRIISLKPEDFSRQLIYHTTNNKQSSLRGTKTQRFVKVTNFLGQLNTVRKKAQRVKQEQDKEAKSWWSIL